MPKTYSDVYIDVRKTLKQAGIEAYNLEARLIVAHAAGKTMEKFMQDLPLYTGGGLDARVRELVLRRLAGEPVAYITGSWEFYGLPIEVTPDVLIPRMDTELLVSTATDSLAARKMDARILDLCSGSGCIACALAHELPASRVVMADISAEALSVGRKNVTLNSLSPRVTAVQADALEKPPMLIGSFDMIVCNPPYIPTGDIEGLDKSVRYYEPLSALDGGEDGMDFFRAVIGGWKDIIRDNGMLLFEVGAGQAEEVKRMMRLAGFKGVDSAFDTGGIERVVYGKV